MFSNLKMGTLKYFPVKRQQLVLIICIQIIVTSAFPFSSEEISEATQIHKQQNDSDEIDNENSRKVLGSSVVTSVSVIMETNNGSHKYFADAAGRPVARPTTSSQLASPVTLLTPDRYEFYTFNDSGELVKRQMTLNEIQKIIAAGGNADTELLQSIVKPSEYQIANSETRVHDVVANVQSVLKEEIAAHKGEKPSLDDISGLSSSWSSIFGNDDDIAVVPDIEMMDQSILDSSNNMKLSGFITNTISKNRTKLSTTETPITTTTPKLETTTLNKETTEFSATTTMTQDPISVTSNALNEQTENSIKVLDNLEILDSSEKEIEFSTTKTEIVTTEKLTTTQQTESTKLVTWIPDFSTTTSKTDEIKPVLKISPENDFVKISSSNDVTTDSDETPTTTTATPTTTSMPSTTMKINDIVTEATETTTSKNLVKDTRPTIIESIDQIIAQVNENLEKDYSTEVPNTVAESVISETNAEAQKNISMDELTAQSATIASVLVDSVALTSTTQKLADDDVALLKENLDEDVETSTVNVETTTKLEMSVIRETSSTSIKMGTLESVTSVEDKTELITETALNEDNVSTTENVDKSTVADDLYSFKSNLLLGENDEFNEEDESTSTETIEKVDITTLPSELLPPKTSSESAFNVESSSYESDELTTTLANSSPSEPLELRTESIEVAESTDKYAEIDNSTPKEELMPPKLTTTLLPPSVESNDESSTIETDLFELVTKLNGAVRSEDEFTEKIFTTTEYPEKFTTVQYTETTTKLSINLEQDNLLTTQKIDDNITTEKLESSTAIPTTDSTEIIPEKTTEMMEMADEPEATESSTTTEKNTWKLVPIITPHPDKPDKEHKHKKPDIKPLKSGIFGFKRPRPPSASPVYPNQNINLKSQPTDTNLGLEATTNKLDTDVMQFSKLCNELAFRIWHSITTSKGLSSVRSVFISPFALTSMLSMIFLGARGLTSGEMNDILKLDDMVTFNPHLVFKNVTESIEPSKFSGVAQSVIIRELFSDRSKGKILEFYKERVRQFYNGYVEEANFKIIASLIRHRTNILVRRETQDKITDYIKGNLISLRSPLAAISANIYQIDCSLGSIEGRAAELHFIVSPTLRQRRLVPVPAVVYKRGFLAGYEPELDATAVALGNDQVTSVIFVVPGQQGNAAPGDGLMRLEKYLSEAAFKNNAWSKLLRTLSPRPGLEVQIPRFSHRSVINTTNALQKMGLRELFNPNKADLRGLLSGNKNELHISDMIQINNFTVCGEHTVSDVTHHIEVYPAVPVRLAKSDDEIILQENIDYYTEDGIRDSKYLEYAEEPRDYQRAFHDPVHDPSIMDLPLALRPRQARIPETTPRLRLDRPFLYFVRHNPTGLILHMGRFNPRLLP